MRFFYYLFLFASIFFHKVLLSNLMNYPRLYPNFNRQPFVLPQGTPAFPICNSPHCMNHWMQQAIPLSQGRHFGYFLPAFVPSGVRSSKLSDLELRSNLRSRRWKRISLIGESYSKKRRFYKTEDSEEIVMVEQNSDTKQLTQKRGQTVYINLEDVTIPETNLEFFGKKPEVKEASPVEPEVKGSPVEPEVKGSPVEP
ncbi:MAG: hypothetical protein GDA46_04025, partial [Bdellovibrionales bacterium]|nr:hypothetical protein [Bdellovibrionales bacterium]